MKQAQQFTLDIDEIDADSGTARVTGTSGPTHVTALLTISSLHFVERTVTGTLTITTVFASEGNVRTYRAVHSRHDYLPMSLPGYVSEPSVSQNYGECEVPRRAGQVRKYGPPERRSASDAEGSRCGGGSPLPSFREPDREILPNCPPVDPNPP